MHVELPDTLENFPGGHIPHVEAPCKENAPAEQFKHVLAPGIALYKPPEHAKQDDEPAKEYCPVVQL